MKEVFVISESSGSYDSFNSYPVAVTDDEEKAMSYIADMEARQKVALKNKEALNAHMKIWEAANPRPALKQRHLTPLPNLKGPKKSWTDEQKELYKKVAEENQKKLRKDYQPIQDWSIANYQEQERFRNSYSPQEAEDIQKLTTDDLGWSYCSIPVIE